MQLTSLKGWTGNSGKRQKNKPSFINDGGKKDAVSLAAQRIVKRRTVRCRNWGGVVKAVSMVCLYA